MFDKLPAASFSLIAQKIPKIQEMSLSNNKNVALSARNIFGVAALAGRASSVRFPVSLKFHRAIVIHTKETSLNAYSFGGFSIISCGISIACLCDISVEKSGPKCRHGT